MNRWLSRKVLSKMGFRPMKKDDYQTFGGAGPDSMILEKETFSSVVDISYDTEYQGLDLILVSDQTGDDAWVRIMLDAVLSIGEVELSRFLEILATRPPDELIALLEKLDYSNSAIDLHQAKELMRRLELRQGDSREVADESLVMRIRKQLPESG